MRKKINNKGFAFAEVLTVTVVIAGIFMIIYSNIFPIMAELENREEYNDLSSYYAAYYLRKYIIDNVEYDKDKIPNLNDIAEFTDLMGELDVDSYIIYNCNISKLKEKNTNTNFTNYIKYLPNYNNCDSDHESYRLLVKTNTGYANTIIYPASITGGES